MEIGVAELRTGLSVYYNREVIKTHALHILGLL